MGTCKPLRETRGWRKNLETPLMGPPVRSLEGTKTRRKRSAITIGVWNTMNAQHPEEGKKPFCLEDKKWEVEYRANVLES